MDDLIDVINTFTGSLVDEVIISSMTHELAYILFNLEEFCVVMQRCINSQ
jgi:hypothetical protein